MAVKKRIPILFIAISTIILITIISIYFAWKLPIADEIMSNIDATEITQNIQDQNLYDSTQHIIFNLNGVLFKEDHMRVIKKIGFGRLASFALSSWKSPADLCLDVLEKMACEHKTGNSGKLMYQGRKLPECIVDWQLGTNTHVDVKKQIAQFIEKLYEQNYFKNKNEREITENIIDIAFNPEKIHEITRPVSTMINLAKKLKNNGHKIYILANMPHEVRESITNAYPDFMNLFDGIVISAEVNALKTEKKLFKHLLTTHKLNPKKCIIIDDEPNAVKIAKSLGMTGITFTNEKSLKNKLKNLDLL